MYGYYFILSTNEVIGFVLNLCFSFNYYIRLQQRSYPSNQSILDDKLL